MKQMEDRALRFIKKLQAVYFEQNDPAAAAAMLDPEFAWSCPGGMGSGRGLAAAKEILKKRPYASARPLKVARCRYSAVPLPDGFCMVQGDLFLELGVMHHPVRLRVSAACRFAGEEERLCGLHVSRPARGQAYGKGISRRDAPGSLTDNIPGGTFRCMNDEKLTLQQMNDGFLAMLGYTRGEIEDRFHNSFWSLIYPEDRQPTQEEVHRQLAHGDTKELEYRMICGDGRLIWVLDKGRLVRDKEGRESYCCILVDITNIKKAQEELRLSLERHKIIMNQTTDIIFEWDIHQDTLLFSLNWEKKFGYEPIRTNISARIAECPHICTDDVPVLNRMMRSVKEGREYSEGELRIQNEAGSFLWCRIRATTQFDGDGKPLKAIGVIIDIDSEKRTSQKLMEKAERDALTGLYNKGTAQAMIEKSLTGGPAADQQALMIFDIDNFKQINDTFGHLCGDAVLADIAGAVQKLFRTTDILGRIGGDEFAVLAKNISGPDAAAKKAQQIIDMFHALTHQEKRCACSCSVGIALYPQDGQCFEELYRNADSALYHAKNMGKNQFAFYQEEKPLSGAFVAEQSSVNETIDSNREVGVFTNQLAEYVFRVLYHSMKIETAIPLILEIVGRQFDVSRVYIFENSEDNRTCTNTFEWCNEGVEPQIGNLKSLSYDAIDSFDDCFNKDGFAMAQDVAGLPEHQRLLLEQQGVRSMLQCAIRDNGVFRGFVGFDECRRRRTWTQEQINGLSLISQLVSIFLFKTRAQSRAEQAEQCLRAILDSQMAWIYVLDGETHEILYRNRKTVELIPEMAVGSSCYKAIFQRDAPCENCPICEISGKKSCRMIIDNPLVGFRVITETAKILWYDGREVLLFSCRRAPSEEAGGDKL